MADTPELAKVPSPAGQQGSEESAIHEPHGLEEQGSQSPLEPGALRKPAPSEDFATKSYDLEELNRLRAMSNPAPVVSAHEVSEEEDDDDDDLMTSRLDARGLARAGIDLSDDSDDSDDAEDKTTSRMRRRAAANRPAGRAPAPTRPEGRATAAAAAQPEQALHAPEGAAGAPSEPSEIEDEDSNDEGPTVRRDKKIDVNNERAVLARPPSGRIEQPTDIEDDPFDDGPTRMRPPEELAPRAEPVLKPLRTPATEANEASWAQPHEKSDMLSGPTERLPEAISANARASSKPRVGAPLPVTPPPAWDADEAQAPTRAIPKPGSMQPLASVPQPAVAPPPAGPPQVQMPPFASSPFASPPFAPPPGAPPLGTLSLGGPLPVAPVDAGRQRLIAALVGVAIGLVVLIIYGMLAEPDALSPAPAPNASASASAEPALPAQPAPSLTASATTTPIGPAEASSKVLPKP